MKISIFHHVLQMTRGQNILPSEWEFTFLFYKKKEETSFLFHRQV